SLDGRSQPTRAYTESLLRYHRPLLEDGEVEYEFYYDPGKVLTHPALGRLAFLLGPDGVRVHRLTDGASDESGLDPANAADEPAGRRGPGKVPLKPKEWNRVKLALAGNQMTVWLNGVEVFERDLGPGPGRTFGLFHYADETEARVRNVTYRGRWERKLPPAGEMLGAAEAGERLDRLSPRGIAESEGGFCHYGTRCRLTVEEHPDVPRTQGGRS